MDIHPPMDGLAGEASHLSRLSAAGLISAVLIGIVGALVIFITPGFLTVLAQHTGLDDEHLGYIAAWDINAMAVTIGLSAFVLSRWRWRWAVAVALALIALGNMATALGQGYWQIALARTIAGAGEGVAIGFSFAALGRAGHPDRAFAIYLVAGALVSSVLLYLMPTLQVMFSPPALFAGNAALTVLVGFCLPYFPEGRSTEDPAFVPGGAIHWRLATGALIGVFLYFFATGAMWSYAERIGAASGLTAQTIARGLSLGTLAGVLGAATVGVLPRRWGRSAPLLISGIVSIASFLLMLGKMTGPGFIAAAVLLLFGWNFAQPLLSGLCAEADDRGRVVCAMGSIQTFGTGLGPAAAGATLVTGGFSMAIWSSVAILAASLAIVLLTVRRQARA